MIAEALSFLANLSVRGLDPSTRTFTRNGIDFFVGDDGRPVELKPVERYPSLALPSLTAFANAVRATDWPHGMIVVCDAGAVTAYSTLDLERKTRGVLYSCETGLPLADIGRATQAQFIRHVLASFDDSPGRASLLEVVGNIKSESTVDTTDDGVSQIVQTRAGIVLGKDVTLPSEINLVKRRSFPEIVRPASLFFLRAERTDSGKVLLTLTEADPDEYTYRATAAVHTWVRTELAGIDSVVVL